MLKDTPYREKFTILKKWMPDIIENVKKDLKNEHLKKDLLFVKKHFGGKNVNKLSTEELVEGYMQAIAQEEAAEEIGEFITNRWLLKNTELYAYFEAKLTQISPNFQEIVEIEKDKSLAIIDEAIVHFGAPRTYLFAVLNSVVFPQDVFHILSQRADDHIRQTEEEGKAAAEHKAKDDLKVHYEQQLARQADKYEKKLQGLQKKYLQDVETLKKQVASLQRKLQGQ